MEFKCDVMNEDSPAVELVTGSVARCGGVMNDVSGIGVPRLRLNVDYTGAVCCVQMFKASFQIMDG